MASSWCLQYCCLSPGLVAPSNDPHPCASHRLPPDTLRIDVCKMLLALISAAGDALMTAVTSDGRRRTSTSGCSRAITIAAPKSVKQLEIVRRTLYKLGRRGLAKQ